MVRCTLGACLALAFAGGAHAQGQGLRIVPGVDFGLSLVDTERPLVNGQGPGLGHSTDLVTSIRPGVSVTGRLGRTALALNYGLLATQHSYNAGGTTKSSSLQNDLNATLRSELIERWLFLDADASITQQAISAFGQQSADNTQTNTNRTEVAQLSVRPSSRGSLAGLAIYDIGLNADFTRVKNTAQPDSRNVGGSASLSSSSGAAMLGWSLSASQQRASFSGGQVSDSTRFSAALLVRPHPEVSGSIRAGQEATKIGSFYDQTYQNWGGNIRWTPSPRTTASISADRRYFGNGYSVVLDHRFSRAAVHFTSTRDVNNGANGRGVGQPLTLFDLLYSQFASQQPDPVLREQLVRDFLTFYGQNPNAIVSGGYVNSGVTIQRRDDLSFSYTNTRSVLTVQAFNSQSRSFDVPAGAFALGDITQYGLLSSFSYRLTPTANASLSASVLRTKGTTGAAAQPGNQLESIVLSWSDRLSKLVTTSVNLRYSEFDSPINPYRESALGASLSLRF